MSAVLDAPELLDRAEISAGRVLVEYSRTEAGLAELKAELAGKIYDLTTTKGDAAARADRLRCVKLRTALEEKRKEFKAPALVFGKTIDSEAARITAAIEALEQPIDAQIRADETRRAAEKAERDRIEAERVAGHRTRIAAIRECVGKARGLPSVRIANGIMAVEALITDETVYQEFAREAADAKAETLAAMRELFAAAKAAEDAAAAQEAQQAEQARVAAEQAAEAARLVAEAKALAERHKAAADALAAQQAEFERARAAFAAEQAAALAPKTPEPAAAASPEIPQDAQKSGSLPVTTGACVNPGAEAAQAPASSNEGKAAPAEERAAEPALDTRPPITTGALCELLGFVVNAAFVQSLGLTPAPRPENAKAGTFWSRRDIPALCDALIAHVQRVKEAA